MHTEQRMDASHFIKLNDDKTELLVLGSPLTLPTLHIGDEEIFCSDNARNIGAIFDTTMKMQGQISKSLEILAK